MYLQRECTLYACTNEEEHALSLYMSLIDSPRRKEPSIQIFNTHLPLQKKTPSLSLAHELNLNSCHFVYFSYSAVHILPLSWEHEEKSRRQPFVRSAHIYPLDFFDQRGSDISAIHFHWGQRAVSSRSFFPLPQ